MKTTNLYFIRDRVADVPETNIMQIQNDLVAVRGFMEFCKKDGVKPVEHELVHILELDEDNNILSYSADQRYVVCNGKNAEEYYNEKVACLDKDSDLEDSE